MAPVLPALIPMVLLACASNAQTAPPSADTFNVIVTLRSGAARAHPWVYIRGASSRLLEKLRALPSVADVSPAKAHALIAPVFEASETQFEAATVGNKTTSAPTPATTTSASWGVSKISAPATWAAGNTGARVVVRTADTGVRATHQTLAGNFRSSYGWYDPDKKASKPYNATGHGTHMTGIIAGTFGIGVASEVQWITCKGCRDTGCYSSDLLACFQFMLYPMTPSGTTHDCSKAPRIVNSSWGTSQGDRTFSTVINAWRAADIIPVFAGGNTGPVCGTVVSPGDHPSVISVDATDPNDALRGYISKGPSVNGAMKPGSSIRSACYTGDTDYCTKSGTSMTAPHVTGTIALYLSANPTAAYDQVKPYLQSTTVKPTLAPTGYSCGATVDGVFPNN